MVKSNYTFQLIADFCEDIVERKTRAVSMMVTDLEAHFCLQGEVFEPLDKETYGIIAISCVGGSISLVTSDGEFIRANELKPNDFDMVLCVWMTFHEK